MNTAFRNIAEEGKWKLVTIKVLFISYILTYERKDGSKSWCDVGTSGKILRNGEKCLVQYIYLK
jgi:hypothetical protein